MRIKNNITKLPIIGKIKVGEKNEKGTPVSLDYFRATGKHENEFNKIFGERPDNIKIIFLDDENSLDVRYELRQGKKLVAYSDGESVFAYDKKLTKYVLQDKPFAELEQRYCQAISSKWNKILRLYFLIPEIKIWGLWCFETKGIESTIPQIEGSYDSVYARAGTVINIPFDLEVKKVISQKPDSKNKYPVVSLTANMSESSMEKLRFSLVNGINISGIITEEKLNQIELKDN
jgi:outer membrane lipoprotein-sorting protein